MSSQHSGRAFCGEGLELHWPAAWCGPQIKGFFRSWACQQNHSGLGNPGASFCILMLEGCPSRKLQLPSKLVSGMGEERGRTTHAAVQLCELQAPPPTTQPHLSRECILPPCSSPTPALLFFGGEGRRLERPPGGCAAKLGACTPIFRVTRCICATLSHWVLQGAQEDSV